MITAIKLIMVLKIITLPLLGISGWFIAVIEYKVNQKNGTNY